MKNSFKRKAAQIFHHFANIIDQTHNFGILFKNILKMLKIFYKCNNKTANLIYIKIYT
jgi:hypothetical protein